MTDHADSRQIASLRRRLQDLAQLLDDAEATHRAAIDRVLPKHRRSALNLAHYLALRQQDIRSLQLELADVGLSSLGRSEGHVLDTIDRLCGWLGHMTPPHRSAESIDSRVAERLLHANTRALFGPRPADRHVYIMVTAPDPVEATDAWADGLLAAGADLLRINGAHGTPADWEDVALRFRGRAAIAGRGIRIIVDLPGPKLRTEIHAVDEGVIHVPRRKDRFGRSLQPSRVLLAATATPMASGDPEPLPTVPIPATWVAHLKVDDELQLTDPSGRVQDLRVVEVSPHPVAECRHSLYVATGLALAWRRHGKLHAEGVVGQVPDEPCRVALAPGDRFVLGDDDAATAGELPALVFPEPQLLAQVREGERVVLDDGKVLAMAEEVRPGALVCRVVRTLKATTRLRSGKGVAFPDSDLALGTLGEGDEQALAFALGHADAVGVSFVNGPADVALIGDRIAASGKAGFGMLLKLETRAAMTNLPAILFEALRYDPVGLMIARGDLAIDVGFERLAEMQEELLWFGEACHLPVVWATQVLDSVAHSGLPTRAEVTDAAMSMRAECVMLNKGPHIDVATRVLADIIRKMEKHQYKKRSLLRPLSIARRAEAANEEEPRA
ncbi:MAG TPA: pyruvate kinase [Burkholderiaceae bacterium]|nr:pyruvate kinase [Burkholderiaceae bacterium]